MPNTTITDLPSASTATGAVIPADQAGSTRKVTPEQILAAAGGAKALTFSTETTGSPPLAKTIDTDDQNAFISCSVATQVLVTEQTAGFRVVLRQAASGTGQVEIFADTGVSLLYPALFEAKTAQQHSVVELLWISNTDVVLVGDLELA